MKRLPVILFCIIILLSSKELAAQCFGSPGNPIAGSANLGVLYKQSWRTILFYKHAELEGYRRGDVKTPYQYVSNANYNFTGFNLGYGLTEKISLDADMGYYINKTQHYAIADFTHNGFGLSNGSLGLKYNFYLDNVKKVEYTAGISAKYPFSLEPMVVNGVRLPIDVQPSTGNFGIIGQSFFVKQFPEKSVRFIIINRYEKNFNENRQGYTFGDAIMSSLFLSKHLWFSWTSAFEHFTAILQLRHEYRGKNKNYGQTVVNSGSQLFYVSPQLNYNLDEVWNISLIADIPCYQYYNGLQLSNKFAFSFSVAKDFGLKH